MKTSLIAFLLAPGFLSLAGLPSPAQELLSIAQSTHSYIGTRYLSNTLPSGVQQRSGWLVGDIDASPNFWASHVREGSQDMLWFQIGLGYQGQQAIFEVIDTAELPFMGPGEGLEIACECNGNPDPEIFAIVRYTDTEYLTQIRHAWRANRTSRQIEPISTEGIRCYNPGWGV